MRLVREGEIAMTTVTTDYDNLMGYCRCLVCDRALMPGMEGYDPNVGPMDSKVYDDGSFEDPICTECQPPVDIDVVFLQNNRGE